MGEETTKDLPRWDLSKDYYTGIDDPKIDEDLEHNITRAEAFEAKHKGKLAGYSAPQLAAAIAEYEAMREPLLKPEYYAHLMKALQQTDRGVAKLYARVGEESSIAGKHLAFWAPELAKLDPSVLKSMYDDSEELAHYKPYLDNMGKYKEHVLPQEVETALRSLAPVSAETLLKRQYSEMLSNLRFDMPERLLKPDMIAACQKRGDYIISDTDGYGTCRLGISEIKSLVMSPDEEICKAAYESRRKAFTALAHQKNGVTPAFIMNTLLKSRGIDDEMRGFAESDSNRHLDNDVEAEVVNTLRNAVKDKGYELNQRYLRLKARVLGKEHLQPWDEDRPLASQGEEKISWKEARDIVLETFNDFSPTMGKIAQRAFDEGWIDADPRPEKRTGAACTFNLRACHPFVRMHFTGKPGDVMTLAHELGHAIHDVLAKKKQGDLMGRASLTFAETASTFAETAVFKNLMERLKDRPEARLALMVEKLDDMMGVSARQIAYDEFEQNIFAERKKKGELSPDRFAELWQETQKKRYGDAIDGAQQPSHTWAGVTHFFDVRHYVYAYAFGDLLANSLYHLYEQMKSEGKKEEFEDKYLALLSSASTEHHDKALTERFGDKENATFDLSNPEFWKNGLTIYEGLLEELEREVNRHASSPESIVAANTNEHGGHIDAAGVARRA